MIDRQFTNMNVQNEIGKEGEVIEQDHFEGFTYHPGKKKPKATSSDEDNE